MQHCRVSGNRLLQHFCHQTGGWKIPSARSTYRQDIAFFCRSPVCSCSTATYPATSCCSTSTTRPAGEKSLQQGRRIGRIFLSSVVAPVCSCSTAAYPATSCCSTSATRPAGGKSRQQGRRIGRIFLSSVTPRSALTALPRIRQQAVSALLSPDWRRVEIPSARSTIGRILLSSVTLRSALAALPRIRQQAVAALPPPDWRVENPVNKVDVSAGYCFLPSPPGPLSQHCRVSGDKLLQHFYHQTGGWKIPSTRSTYRQDIAFFRRSPVCSHSTAAYPATSCCSTSATRLAGGKSLQQGRRIGRILLSSVVLRSALAALPRIRQQAVAALPPPDRGVGNPVNKVDDRQGIAFFRHSPVCSCSTSTTRLAGRKSLQQGRRIGRVFLSSVVLRSALAALPRIRQQAVAALLPPDWRVGNPVNKVDVSAGYCFLPSFSGLLLQHCRVSGDKLLQHFYHQTGGWKIPSARSTYRQGIAFFCRSPVRSRSTAAYPATSCCSTSGGHFFPISQPGCQTTGKRGGCFYSVCDPARADETELQGQEDYEKAER